jgi:hypothetical protein
VTHDLGSVGTRKLFAWERSDISEQLKPTEVRACCRHVARTRRPRTARRLTFLAVLHAGAACVKLQFDCLSVGVKIELDHGPINAPLMSALGQ